MKHKEKRQAAWTTAAAIMALAWPTIAEQVMQTAVQYIDTAMVGSLGTQATAAVGATSTVAWLVGSSFSALGVGFLALISKACGAGDLESAKKAAAQTCLVVLTAGSVATVACTAVSGVVPAWMQTDPAVRELAGTYFFILYLPMLFRAASILFGTVLRAAGETRTVSLLGLELSVPGAGWGVVGAAVASALSYVWGGIHITWRLWHHPLVSPKGMSLKPDMSILRPCVKISVPNMLQRFGTSLGYVVFASMINSIGEAATAAHTIANTVESAFYIPAYGMQTAAATLAGNAYGAGDRKRMRALANMFLPIEVGLMILSGAALFFSAPVLVGLFTGSGEVITLGSTVLRMVAVSEPFYGVSIIVEGLMMGVGKTKAPFLYNITGMWCVRIVGAMVCIRFLRMVLSKRQFIAEPDVFSKTTSGFLYCLDRCKVEFFSGTRKHIRKVL